MSNRRSISNRGTVPFGDFHNLHPISEFVTPPQPREHKGPINVPLLPVRDTVIFPHLVSPLLIGRDRSMKAVEAAQANQESVVVVAQRDPEAEEPRPEDLYGIGCEVIIARTLRMPDGTSSVLTQGQRRAQIIEFTQTEPYFRAVVQLVDEDTNTTPDTLALMRAVLALFEKVVYLNRSLPEDAYIYAMNIEEPGWLADLIASTIDLNINERQEILEIFKPDKRLQNLSINLAKKLDVLELEDQIHSRVQREVDRTQREFYLREQMKVIQNELGEGDLQTQEINDLREKLAKKNLPEEVRIKSDKELQRLQLMPIMAPEVGIIRTYLDWILELPWSESTDDNLDVSHAEKILDDSHYGLSRVKERILEYIAVRKLAADKMRSPILCFIGPPGTGKTSIGEAIATALGRKFVRVSLGGIRDEAEIRGHRRTYIGALPGRVLQTMRRAETNNPLFMLDEIDKVGADFRGDPAAALLEALDPEQNNSFSDHYLDLPYDLSHVMFVTTGNVLDTIPPALRDRMEIIRFPGYIEEEKVMIAKKFVIPKKLIEHGLTPKELRISDDAIRALIREYTYEAGVRNLERELANLCRKTARRVAEEKTYRRRITPDILNRYLGPARFLRTLSEEKDEIGVATSVAWTEAGGDILPIEVTLMRGRGTLTLTGQLGDVMQESAQAALSYTRSKAKELHISATAFEKTDVHIHVPEGAIPKDGPSAGITMATALISAFTKKAVRRDLGMTGEITLRGHVLPIGGLREKVLAAHRAGLKNVILPKKNEKDLIEVPKKIRSSLNIYLVNSMDQVLKLAFVSPKKKSTRTRKTRKKRSK